jgi:hypothetical protein
MQLPSIDRTAGLRPSGADLVSPVAAAHTIPLAPVNPVNSGPSPSVVNQINPNSQALAAAKAAEVIHSSVSDPAQRGSEAATAQKDWTIHRPVVEKQEIPPPEPISKLLLEFLHNMWRASGSAVEASLAQAQAQNQTLNANPNTAPGEVAKAAVTYSPTKITKTEDI